MATSVHQPRKVVVYGAGGHGRVVADAAAAGGDEVVGFLDDNLPVGTPVLTWRVVGNLGWAEDHRDVALVHGIGANDLRRQATWSLANKGLTFASVIHPSAVLSRHAQVGDGTVVLALAVVNAGALVGAGVIINTGAIIEHDVTVGDFAHVASNATLAGGARIDTLGMLGTGGSVLPSRSIGRRSTVGAGAVVVRDVPADCVAAGVPARVLQRLKDS